MLFFHLLCLTLSHDNRFQISGCTCEFHNTWYFHIFWSQLSRHSSWRVVDYSWKHHSRLFFHRRYSNCRAWFKDVVFNRPVLALSIGKSTALLLSAVQCTPKGRLLMESVFVSGKSPSCKESKIILSPNSKIWSTFSAVQWQQAEEPSLSNNKADMLIADRASPLDNTLNRSWPWWIYCVKGSLFQK